MRYYPPGSRQNLDLALLLRCCPHCMGDLEFREDFTGKYYSCLQCSTRTDLPDAVRPQATLSPRESRLTRPGLA